MKHRALPLPFALILLSVVPLMAQVPAQPSPTKAEPPETLLTGCLRSGGADTTVAGPSGRLYTLEVTETPTATTTPTRTVKSDAVSTYPVCCAASPTNWSNDGE